jgi:hypothetical protein
MNRGWLLFLRLHGTATCLAWSLIHALALVLLGHRTVSAGIVSPSTTIDVPLVSVLPAVAVLAFVPVVDRPLGAERTAVRELAWYRWGLLLALLAVATGMLLLVSAFAGDPGKGLTAARNLVGFLGLAVTLRPWLGDASWIIPAMFAATELVFGGTAYQTPQSWAWTLHDTDSPWAALVATLLAAIGAALLRQFWSRRARRH